MSSLRREVMLRNQARREADVIARAEALARASQVAASTVPVGDDDLPIIDTVEQVDQIGEDFPGVSESADQAADDAFDAAITVGEVAGSVVEQNRIPAVPTGLGVLSNTAVWGEGFTPISTVGLGWDAVTTGDDGEPMVCSYEVWSRLPSGFLSVDTQSLLPEVAVEAWASGVARVVAVCALSAHGMRSAFSDEILVTPAAPASVVPAAPGELTLASNVGTFTSAGPVAAVTLTIPAVTLATDGEPIVVSEYELWDADGPLFRLPASPAKLTIPSDAVRVFRVRAGTAQGVWGDLSEPLSVTGALPGEVARIPTAPELKSGFGVVAARWDGLYESGGTSGAHTVMVESRIGIAAWIVQGAPLTGVGGATFEGSAGDVVEVRLRAYDQLGRLTGTSDTATITVVAIGGDDLDAEDIWANEAWLNRLRVGVIEVDMLEPGFGDTINLNGNVSIQPIRDRQDDQDGLIQEAQEAADAAQTSADDAAADASANQAALTTLAQGRVLSAEVALAALSGKIDTYDNSFLFDSEGFHIRESRTAASEMLFTSAGVRMLADGTVVSEWNQGQFIVSQIIAAGGQLGNHIIESSLPGHTTFRAISQGA